MTGTGARAVGRLGFLAARVARHPQAEQEDQGHPRALLSAFCERTGTDSLFQMSATINQAQFSNYYGGAPCIEIPGFVLAVSLLQCPDWLS